MCLLEFTDRRALPAQLAAVGKHFGRPVVPGDSSHLEQLRKEGYPVNAEDVARLSPLMSDHINVLGRYAFAMPEAVARGELRPLRNPNAEED